jgi:DNA-binding NarL/FixJ family response regulator
MAGMARPGNLASDETASQLRSSNKEADLSRMPKRRIRVVVADDRRWARAGLRAILSTRSEIEVAGEAADGQEALALVKGQRPDVVLLDARMPVLGGIEATRLVKTMRPEIRVVVMSMHSAYRSEALAAGADRFLVKGCPTRELFEAILGSNGHDTSDVSAQG